jgi:hypothetical protein
MFLKMENAVDQAHADIQAERVVFLNQPVINYFAKLPDRIGIWYPGWSLATAI